MKHERFDTTDRNAAIFMAPAVAKRYGNPAPFAAEAMILLRYKETFAGKRVLDLGVGAGRTTQYLAPFATDYLGIDVSPAMLALARARYPNARFADMDLREIGKLQQESFDFIFGPWNILSAFNHDERVRIIKHVHNLLVPGGMFAFSVHNRDWKHAGGHPLSKPLRPRNVVDALHPMSWVNYLSRKKHRREETDYAILNDEAHRWQGVFYYISPHAQLRQLQSCGFEFLEALAEDGRTLRKDEPTDTNGTIHYVGRKP
ncbi:MAG: class I SAM-dependent methyltransferase [Methylobacteriaceae bacterium]|nr:class I SAM-dependent methyltransferase [Methylobacteriaceae bacterium]